MATQALDEKAAVQRQSAVPDTTSTTSAASLETSTSDADRERTSDFISPDKAPDVPPNGGYGWVCVACVFLINGHTWGINSSYGIFLAHYLAANTYPEATPLDYGFIGGLSVSMALLVSPIATTVVREYGTRTCLLIGVAFEFAALLGASFTAQIWQLFLSQGVCFGWGMGFLFVGSVGVVPQWFTTRRSLANGIGTAGSGIGALIYSLATQAMISSIGLGWAFRVLAILALAVNGICALLIRDRNKQVGAILKAFDAELFRRPEYWLLLFWGFFSMLGYIVLLFSIAAYARAVGLTASQASIISALLNLGQGLGRPFIGYFSDAAGRINMAILTTLLSGVLALVVWIFATSYGVLIFYALVGGTVAGTYWTTVAPVGAEVVGLQKLPSALSINWLFLVLPCTFAEPIGLQLRTGPNGDEYLHAQLFTGFMYIGAALCLWFVRAWKVRELAAAEEVVSRGGGGDSGNGGGAIAAGTGVAGSILAEGKREAEIRDDDQVPGVRRPGMSRTTSRAVSVKSVVKDARGLWSWQRV